MPFIILTMSLLLSIIIILIAATISKKQLITTEKSSPYECGFEPISITRIPFSSRFFLIATIFLIFDGELALILPISLMNFQTSYNVITFSTFIMILIIGLFWEWKEGALKWIE
uniref:NADH-ubiquinone oxidoreductase chain 3 n=1 Tax=Mastigoproctus giganteus TaxID=58767 RepID=B1Q0F7_MASGI|nr:NADH dehydrogenase subunit 3 [Mastigoproctus giganteus]